MALRLSRLFGNAPECWMNAQRAVDLWDAMQVLKREVARIKPLRVASRCIGAEQRSLEARFARIELIRSLLNLRVKPPRQSDPLSCTPN